MEDIPQPSSESYSVGDRVQVYLDPSDHDQEYHGRVCEVTKVYTDELKANTGRSTDSYTYEVQDVSTGEILPMTFRHLDLVPHDDSR